MDKVLEQMIADAYLESTVPNAKGNFQKFHNYVKLLEKVNAFVEGKGKVAADNPLDTLNQHCVTIAWEKDILKGDELRSWIEIISLADEQFNIADNKGNISTTLSVYDLYSESESDSE